MILQSSYHDVVDYDLPAYNSDVMLWSFSSYNYTIIAIGGVCKILLGCIGVVTMTMMRRVIMNVCQNDYDILDKESHREYEI